MRNSGLILLPSLCLLASAIAAGQTEAHDLKITTRHGHGPNDTTTTTYYSGENSRSEIQISAGDEKGHRRAVIRRKGADNIQIYDLDLDAHEYASYQTDLHGIMPRARPIAVKPTGKTYLIDTNVVDTGERREMFGHIARHLITKEKRVGGPENCYGENSESEIDGWYIDYEGLPLFMRPKAGVSAYLVAHSAGIGSPQCSDKIEAHRTGPPTGFPLKETRRVTDEMTQPSAAASSFISQMEVVEFAEAPPDPTLFEVPDDFKRVHEIVDPTQRKLQALTYWEKFKAELWDFFH